MVKVSVIIPVYNTEKYLISCLNSVLNQTIDNYEVIAVNDNSSDNSLNILNYYQSKYPYKLKVINLDNNHGVSYARNIGLRYAQGEYIYFMDSDDIVSLDYLNDFYTLAKLHDLDVVEGNNVRILENEFIDDYILHSRFINRPKEVDYKENYRRFFYESPGVWIRLFRHDFLDGVEFIEGKIFEDIGFIYPLLLNADGIYEWVRDDYGYRYTPNSIMESNHQINYKMLDIIDVCKYSNELGIKFNLDEYKLNLLHDVNKLYIAKKMNRIASWKYESKSEKEKILQEYADICYTIFGKYNEFKFELPKRSIVGWDKNVNKYIDNAKEVKHLEFKKNNLSRKLKKLEK